MAGTSPAMTIWLKLLDFVLIDPTLMHEAGIVERQKWDFWSTAYGRTMFHAQKTVNSSGRPRYSAIGSRRTQARDLPARVASPRSRAGITFMFRSPALGHTAPSFSVKSKPSRTSSRYRPCRPTWGAKAGHSINRRDLPAMT